MSPSERLADAHNRVAKADRALVAATAAAAKAAELVATVDAEVLEFIKRDEAFAAERAEGLKRALRSGAASKLNSTPATTKARAERLDAEGRQAIARRAAEDLAAEERDARAGRDDAHSNLDLSARAAVIAEIENAHVVRIIALERELVAHRVAVAGLLRSGVGGWDNALIGQRARSIAADSDRTPIGTRNTPEWAAANQVAETLRARQAAFTSNPAAAPIVGAVA